jgi:hypothetical protein
MKDEIIEHYKSNFNSSPVDIPDEQIAFLIENDCQCTSCGKSIFEMDDFPEISIKDSEVLCEDCYSENYRNTCPICEDSYDIKEFTSDYLVISEDLAVETKKKPGIYKILERPFFFGNILSGFDAFFDNAIELVVHIRINEFKKIDCGDGCCEVGSDIICPECIEKFVRKSNYLKSDRIPCILIKKYETDPLFKDYTPEQLHQTRQRIIHQRITCRGIIEAANHFKPLKPQNEPI